MRRKWNRIILLVLPLVAVLFVWRQWDTWFYNPPEPVYHVSKSPGQILMTLTDGTPGSREITWQGDTLAGSGRLQLMRDTLAGDTITLDAVSRLIRTPGGAANYFRVRIEKLKPSSGYRYRVSAGQTWSDWYRFRLAGSADTAWSFVYFGDVQDTIGGLSGKLFRKAIDRQPDTELLVFGGDLVERPHNAYWEEWFGSGGDLFRTIPVIATPGNHEYHKGLVNKLDSRWNAHFALTREGSGPDGGCVSWWDYQNVRFISLDSNGIQSLPTALKQRNWLKRVLEQTHQRWIVLLMHHPLYATSRGHNYFYLRYLFKPLIDRYHVDMVLSGHDHVYGRAAHIANDVNPAFHEAVYIVSHAGPKHYDIGFSGYMDRMISNTAMYQLFTVTDRELRFHAYSGEGLCLDSLVIHKDQDGHNQVAAMTGPQKPENLNPSQDFLKKASVKKLEEFNRDRDNWIQSKQ